jgi:hypothetical protein
MSPSTLLTVSAPTIFWLSRLNGPPHAIVVYASRPPSPTDAQHSLAGGRYPFPAPDFHRLDRASLPVAHIYLPVTVLFSWGLKLLRKMLNGKILLRLGLGKGLWILPVFSA